MKSFNHRLSSSTRGRIVKKMKEGYTTLSQIQPFFPRTEINNHDLFMIKEAAFHLKLYESNGKTYRICTGCKSHKERTGEFFPYRTKDKSKLHPTCRKCKTTRAMAKKRRDIKKSRAYARDYYHKTKDNESRKKAYEKRKDKQRVENMTPLERDRAKARRAKAARISRERKTAEIIKQKRLSLNENTNG